ncbi:hypothetical protein CCUS01_04968 [Colletotrichum cuscutae]|uniref:Uncharacterized protein n=1 Tax=Colletotrichum cuscutae TaxID=1209917 RepID=A0AAI9VB00_9PEZI|nr:hypothetical protein CCUS01_04968 [Colletotrichum cuscutae]
MSTGGDSGLDIRDRGRYMAKRILTRFHGVYRATSWGLYGGVVESKRKGERLQADGSLAWGISNILPHGRVRYYLARSDALDAVCQTLATRLGTLPAVCDKWTVPSAECTDQPIAGRRDNPAPLSVVRPNADEDTKVLTPISTSTLGSVPTLSGII